MKTINGQPPVKPKAQTLNHGLSASVYLLLGIVLILAIGFYVIFWVGQKEARLIKANALNITKIIAASIDIDGLRRLTGSANDFQNHDYQILRQQLLQAGREVKKDGLMWIYLMGYRQQQIFFYVDSSEDWDDPDYPGEVYDDAPNDFYKVFQNPQEAVIGPYSDKWGNFISVLVPLKDKNNQLVAFIGADIDTGLFALNIRYRQLPLIIITFLIALLYSLVFVYFRKRWRLEYLLLEEKNKLSHILNSLPLPVFYKNKLGIYEDCNLAFTNFFGINRPQIVGRSDYDLVAPGLADRHYLNDYEILKNQTKQIFPGEITLSNGDQRSVVFHKSVVLNHRGQVLGIVGVIIDVTENQKQEAELRRHNEELERFSKISIDREWRMIELKGQIKELEDKLRQLTSDKK